MSSSFGEAFLDVTANVDPFLAQIEELKRAVAAQTVTLSVNARQAGAAARAASAVTNTSTTISQFDATGADEAIAAQRAIADSSRSTADAEISDIARVGAARAADSAAAIVEAERVRAAQGNPSAAPATGGGTNSALLAAIAQVQAAQNAAAAADIQRSAAERTAAQAAADQINAIQARQLLAGLDAQKAADEAQRAEIKDNEAFRVAAEQAAADAMRAINRQTADQLRADLAQQVAEEQAAAAIRRTISDADQASARADIASIQARTVAERAAATVAEDAARLAVANASSNQRSTLAGLGNGSNSTQDVVGAVAALAAARSALQDLEAAAGTAGSAVGGALKDVEDTAGGLGDKIKSVSSTLSQLGFTGQARMIALAATIGFPIAVLGVFVAAAGAASLAIAKFGIQAGDDLRSATLNFIQAGDSAKQATADVQALLDLSKQGLAFPNLIADAQALEQIGVKAKNATPFLQALADSFAAGGDVGAKLQTDVDAAIAAIATLSQKAVVTAKDFATSVKNSLLGVTATDVRTELERELDVTSKKLDDLFAKGKITGAQVAQAAVNAAGNGANGALAAAVNESPTQAVTSLKDSLSAALGQAFQSANPAIAKAINDVSAKLNAIVGPFADEVAKALPGIIDTLASVLPALGTALVDSFKLIGPIIKDIAPIISGISKSVINFFDQASTKGSPTANLLDNLKKAFEGIGLAIEALRPVVGVVFSVLQAAIAFLGPALLSAGAVLKVISDALSPIATLIERVFGNSVVQKVLKVVGAIAGGVAGVLLFTNAIGALGVAFDFLTGPVGIVLALAAAVVYAYEHFQTFRAIVRDAFEAIVTVVGTAVKILVDVFAGLVTGYLEGFKLILEGLSHLPKWLGGGLFTDAANAVQDLINGVGAVKDKVDGLVDSGIAAAKALDFHVTPSVDTQPALDALAALDDAARQTALDATLAGNATAAQQSAAAQLDNAGLGEPSLGGTAPTNGHPVLSTFNAPIKIPAAGGGSAVSAANSAASAIKTATKTMDTAIKGFVTAVGGVQTQQDVTNAFKTLYDAITAYDAAIGKKEPTGLNAYVYKEEGAVRALVAQIVKINAAIAAANAEITSALSFANVVSSAAATATADLSKLTITGGTALTAIQKLGLGIISATSGGTADNSFEAGLKAKLAALQDFAADIKKAQAQHLDPNLVADFLSAGPDSDAQLKSILASGVAGIGAINATQQAINAAAAALGDQAAKNSLATGAAVADGFIAGLQAQSKKLDAAATALGNQIAAAVKKSLGIKSPSRVAMGISNHFMDGLHIPLAGRVKETVALAEAHAKAMSSAFDKAGADPTMRKQMIELTGVAGSDQKHAELMGALKDIHSATAGAPRTTIHAPVHVNAASAPAPVVADHVGRVLARLR